jgi:hypothetical protein
MAPCSAGVSRHRRPGGEGAAFGSEPLRRARGGQYRRGVRTVVAAVAVAALLGCGDGGPTADPEAFCLRLDRLTTNDPFLAFGDTATPTEIEQGFEALVTRADELLEVAPEDVRPAARRYRDAAVAMDELMAEAGYDGARLDARAYREEEVTYTEAADLLIRYLEVECSDG